MIDLKNCSETGEAMNSKISDELVVEAYINSGLVKNDGGDCLLIFDSGLQFWKRFGRKNANAPLRELIVRAQRFILPYSRMLRIIDLLLSASELTIRFNIERNATLVHVLNGVFDLETGKLRAVDPQDVFDYVLNVNFKSDMNFNVDFPNFRKFMLSSLRIDKCPNNEVLLRQMLGTLVTDLPAIKKSFFWIGRSNAGKSLLVKVLRAAAGTSTSVALHELGDRFRLALLRGSRINIADEIRQVPMQALDNFKKITSQDMIVIEEKGKNPENVVLRTKFLFVGNSLPGLTEYNCEAVLNRMALLFFDTSIANCDWIPDLDKKLLAEKDEIFTWALMAVPNLIKSNFAFAKPEPSTSYMATYREEVASVQTFLSECCTTGDYDKDPSYKIHLADIRKAYFNFCDKNGFSKQPVSTLKEQIASLKGVVPSKFRIGNSSPLHGYLGITLKKVDEDDAT